MEQENPWNRINPFDFFELYKIDLYERRDNNDEIFKKSLKINRYNIKK